MTETFGTEKLDSLKSSSNRPDIEHNAGEFGVDMHYGKTVDHPQPTVYKILLVEDNPEDARLVIEMLIDVGAEQFNIMHVKQLKEAFKHLNKDDFDIVLLDLYLPDGKGLDTLLRMHAFAPTVPVMVLTGLSDEDLAVQAVRQGAQDYLVKGEMDGKWLVRGMRYAIERNRLRMDLEARTQDLQQRETNFYNMIATNVDGMIILDTQRVVRFINPAAQAMFGSLAEEILGEVWSFSVIAGETRELCIIRPNGDTSTAEVRVVETTWQGSTAYLASLRDITARKQAEAALIEQKSFLRQVIDTSPNLIFVKDWHGKFILANQAVANIYGTTIENLIGKTDRDFNQKSHEVEEFIKFDRQVMTTLQEHRIYEEKVTDFTGKVHWFQTIKKLLISSDGINYQVLGISADITERKTAEIVLQKIKEQLEIRVRSRTAELKLINHELKLEIIERTRAESALRKSEERFRQLLEQAGDAFFLHDLEGKLITVNQRACDSLGYTREELLTLTLADFEINFISERLIEKWQEMVSGIPITVNGVHLRKDGTTFPVEVSLGKFELDGHPHVLALARDITERQRAELEIRNALKKEKELNEFKSNFITIASHEFRTPLTSILAAAEVLEHYGYKYTDEKKLSYLHRIQSSVQHMTQLLNDVLILAKVEAGKLEFKPHKIDLHQFCRELTEEMAISDKNQHKIIFISNKNEYLSTIENPSFCMDEKLLRHILTNLLSNAIKYSPAGSTVRFELDCQNEKAIFYVQDQGIGIPLENQNLLFQSFYRAKNVGNISGTGLGLAIVKNAIDLHGGSINVNSDLGVGTTFTVVLPSISQ